MLIHFYMFSFTSVMYNSQVINIQHNVQLSRFTSQLVNFFGNMKNYYQEQQTRRKKLFQEQKQHIANLMLIKKQQLEKSQEKINKKQAKKQKAQRKKLEKSIKEKLKAPKQPNTAYFMFFMDYKEKIKQDFPQYTMVDMAKMAGKLWKQLEQEQKQVYHLRHEAEKKNYEEALEQYKEKRKKYEEQQQQKEKWQKAMKAKPIVLQEKIITQKQGEKSHKRKEKQLAKKSLTQQFQTIQTNQKVQQSFSKQQQQKKKQSPSSKPKPSPKIQTKKKSPKTPPKKFLQQASAEQPSSPIKKLQNIIKQKQNQQSPQIQVPVPRALRPEEYAIQQIQLECSGSESSQQWGKPYKGKNSVSKKKQLKQLSSSQQGQKQKKLEDSKQALQSPRPKNFMDIKAEATKKILQSLRLQSKNYLVSKSLSQMNSTVNNPTIDANYLHALSIKTSSPPSPQQLNNNSNPYNTFSKNGQSLNNTSINPIILLLQNDQQQKQLSNIFPTSSPSLKNHLDNSISSSESQQDSISI